MGSPVHGNCHIEAEKLEDLREQPGHQDSHVIAWGLEGLGFKVWGLGSRDLGCYEL